MRQFYLRKKPQLSSLYESGKKKENDSFKENKLIMSDYKNKYKKLPESDSKENIKINGQNNKFIKKNLFKVNFSKTIVEEMVQDKSISGYNKKEKDMNCGSGNETEEDSYKSKKKEIFVKKNFMHQSQKSFFQNTKNTESNSVIGYEIFRNSQPINNFNKKKFFFEQSLNSLEKSFSNEISQLIKSTAEKIEKEKDNQEGNNYLQEVKKKLTNNLTKGSLALIQMEINHANKAIENKIYITYVSLGDNGKFNTCFRLGENSMCVCGHGFKRHELAQYNDNIVSRCKKCPCERFKYIPMFPEETNLYKISYLLDFNYNNWKAPCKCGHDWTKHSFNQRDQCSECDCESFLSEFTCAICSKSWEEHQILFETEEERKKYGETFGESLSLIHI